MQQSTWNLTKVQSLTQGNRNWFWNTLSSTIIQKIPFAYSSIWRKRRKNTYQQNKYITLWEVKMYDWPLPTDPPRDKVG